jgi:DNA-binding MarR family transcriptional regulator
VTLRLTAAGRALRERAGALPVRMARLTGCSSDELARLRRQLVRLREAIDAGSGGLDVP